MRLEETLGIDCEWLKVDVSWAEGEYERLTAGMRFLTKEDVALLRMRLASQGAGIAPESLYAGLDQVYVRRSSWYRVDPYPSNHYVEYHFLSDPFSTEDDGWEVYAAAIALTAFSVKEMEELLERK